MGGWRGIDYDLPILDNDGDDGNGDNNAGDDINNTAQLRNSFRKNLTLSTADNDEDAPRQDAK